MQSRFYVRALFRFSVSIFSFAGSCLRKVRSSFLLRISKHLINLTDQAWKHARQFVQLCATFTDKVRFLRHNDDIIMTTKAEFWMRELSSKTWLEYKWVGLSLPILPLKAFLCQKWHESKQSLKYLELCWYHLFKFRKVHFFWRLCRQNEKWKSDRSLLVVRKIWNFPKTAFLFSTAEKKELTILHFQTSSG